jgi:hypothetical protein
MRYLALFHSAPLKLESRDVWADYEASSSLFAIGTSAAVPSAERAGGSATGRRMCDESSYPEEAACPAKTRSETRSRVALNS